jgi:transcriptional regulator GlxA family with amidase domain
MRPVDVAAIALPGVISFELGIVAQAFGRPARLGDAAGDYTLTTCTARPGRVATADGFDLHLSRGLDALETADLVVVPGHVGFADPPPDAVLSALSEAHERGASVASLCTGAFVLGFAGLLDGRRATTHWATADQLAALFPACTVDPDVLWVDEGGILSSAGLAAGLDLCLHLVRRDRGAAAAAELARWNVVAPHREGGQAQFIPSPAAASAEGLGPTLAWAVEHIDEEIDVPALAAHAHLSPRTLARRFEAKVGMTPKRWLRAQRVALARELLETSDLSVSEVACRAGFGSTSGLRAQLKRHTATTPTAYRTAFRGVTTTHA